MKSEDEKYSAEWWSTPFGAWVREFGTGRLRRELQVTKSAVHAWVAGVISPRPKKAERIVELSQGKLTLEMIYRQPRLVGRSAESGD